MVQAVLLVAVASAFLLLPVVASRVSRSWLEPQSRAALMTPPLWFVGLQEAAIGDFIVDLPRPTGRRLPRPHRRSRCAGHRDLSARAHALPRAGADGADQARGRHRAGGRACLRWNNRRMVPPPPAEASAAAGCAAAFGAAARLVIRHPETQASFFFTMQAMLRSPQHRLTIAASLAFGLTAACSPSRSAAPRAAAAAMPLTAGVLAVQPVLLAALLIGFRHAVRVPAELAANWAVQVAWTGDTRPHIAGAKAAGALLFVVIPVAGARPALCRAVFTPQDAAAIALCGLAGGAGGRSRPCS